MISISWRRGSLSLSSCARRHARDASICTASRSRARRRSCTRRNELCERPSLVCSRRPRVSGSHDYRGMLMLTVRDRGQACAYRAQARTRVADQAGGAGRPGTYWYVMIDRSLALDDADMIGVYVKPCEHTSTTSTLARASRTHASSSRPRAIRPRACCSSPRFVAKRTHTHTRVVATSNVIVRRAGDEARVPQQPAHQSRHASDRRDRGSVQGSWRHRHCDSARDTRRA